jgi:predicted dehydrogenase
VSSIIYEKARDLYASGALGDVFFIEGSSDRNSPSGAWVYPIPPDASEQTIDWNEFLVGAPKRPFDAARFFRWRCFFDYGEGLAGDLFVHLLSGIHFISGTNETAQRAQSSGGLFRWKDGRDFPDLIETLYDYPKFRVVLRCNLNNAGGEPIKFHGTKGTMEIIGQTLTFMPQDITPKPEEYSTKGWPARLRKEYLAQWTSGARSTRLSTSRGGNFHCATRLQRCVCAPGKFFRCSSNSQAHGGERGVRQSCGHRLSPRQLRLFQEQHCNLGRTREDDSWITAYVAPFYTRSLRIEVLL